MSTDDKKKLLQGLTSTQAKTKLKKYGPNELQEKTKSSPLKIFIRQFEHNYVIYLLFAAALISFLVDKQVTAYVILGVITLVVSVGFFLEYKAEKAIEALKKMVTRFSFVIRDGQEKQITASEIVPGDIVILKNGEYIPADCVILEAKELYVNESILTGESKEVQKTIAENTEKPTDENMLYMGSYVVNGKCTALVTGTGMSTKFGSIAHMISSAEKEMPLQDKINDITKYMVIISIVFSLLTGLVMVIQAQNLTNEVLVNILIVVIALSVSAVPEGLPVVLVTTLASGALRMAHKNAVVNRMSIIGTIGQATVICSDKTGTITKGEMTVKKIIANNTTYDVTGSGYTDKGNITHSAKDINFPEHETLHQLIKTAILCNDAQIKKVKDTDTYTITGVPTEVALLILGQKVNLSREDFQNDRKEEKPFSSARKLMSVLTNEGTVYVKGAPEIVVHRCTHIETDQGTESLTAEGKENIEKTIHSLASQAFRTLALAYKQNKSKIGDYTEEGLTWLGIVAIEDPPREEVKEALSQCHSAGIKVKIITGDNKQTASAIATQIGLKGNVIEGKELDEMSDAALMKKIDKTVIFARVRPEHKVRIVKALKEKDEIVAMTGDGVNDAPALKEAHIGIAMGKNGTDVSRSVADITLKDDNFATIVTAIREGRGIFANIRTFVSYQLSCNLAQLSIIFLSVLLGAYFGWEIPLLTALQILFVNLVTDNIPSIILGLLPPSKDAMHRKPYTGGLLTKAVLSLIIFTGVATGALVLGIFAFYFNHATLSHDHARSVAFISFILLAITNALNFRSSRKFIFEQIKWENRYLFAAVLISFLVTLLAIYTPLNQLFEIVPLSIQDWQNVGLTVLILAVIITIYKVVNNRIIPIR